MRSLIVAIFWAVFLMMCGCLQGAEYAAELVRVMDGDTALIKTVNKATPEPDLEVITKRTRILRFHAYDAPETKRVWRAVPGKPGKKAKVSPEEVVRGKLASVALNNLLRGRVLKVRITKLVAAYGRTEGTLYRWNPKAEAWENVTELMRRAGHVR